MNKATGSSLIAVFCIAAGMGFFSGLPSASASCIGPDYCYCHASEGLEQVAFIADITAVEGETVSFSFSGGNVYCTDGVLCDQSAIPASLSLAESCAYLAALDLPEAGNRYVVFAEQGTGCLQAAIVVEGDLASCMQFDRVNPEQVLFLGLKPRAQCRDTWLDISIDRGWTCEETLCGCGATQGGLLFLLFVFFGLVRTQASQMVRSFRRE